jgi:hypothetical protein
MRAKKLRAPNEAKGAVLPSTYSSTEATKTTRATDGIPSPARPATHGNPQPYPCPQGRAWPRRGPHDGDVRKQGFLNQRIGVH